MGRKKGSTPWNKGLTKEIDPRVKGAPKGNKYALGHRRVSWNRGLTKEIDPRVKGYVMSEETRNKISESVKHANLIRRLNRVILDESEWKTCYFCHQPIKKSVGNESDSLMIHHINGNHEDNRPENVADAHFGCHSAYNAKGNRYAVGNRGNYHTPRIFSEECKKKISEGLKGNKNALGHRHSKETRRKIGEAGKGNQKVKGKHWKWKKK